MNNETGTEIPWYKRTFRWVQTNLSEMDPIHCDLNWWKEYWHKTRAQGVIINAGGIVAYYPSSIKLQYQAKGLGDKDLFGKFVTEARKEGLTVLARMDSSSAMQEFYNAHPDWFVVKADGEPVKAGGRYITCVNGAYYKEYIPQVLKEIIRTYQPDGFTDNNWTGAPYKIVCHCENCKRKFKKDSGFDLPASTDWNDHIYQKWIKWSYACRMENWDLFNQVTQDFGGPDCLWLGMFNANAIMQANSFCDLKVVGERAKMIICDHQARRDNVGFEQNGLNGHLLHGVAGWNIVIPECTANYVLRGERVFRQGSNPPEETRLWMIEGIAGGISPCLHHIGGVQEDRRQFDNAPPVMQWQEKNEAYLYNRLPVANIGLVWSQENTEFYGRDDVEEKVSLPWKGFVRALTRARIPFIPVHADHITRDAKHLDVLILPDLAAMTDSQCQAVRQFVESGGSLLFTGATATRDEWGNARDQFPLQSITGINHLNSVVGAVGKHTFSLETLENFEAHNYFRLPHDRHSVLSGFENTDILPFGGNVHRVHANEQMKTIATYIPSYPIYPPEFSWMREPQTDIPVMFAGEHASGGRIFYFAGDVDRCYGRTHLPDLGDLLANAVKWAADDNLPFRVEGPGYLDCKLYRQNGRLIFHLINLSGCNQNPGYLEEYLPVGPITISLKVDEFVPTYARMKVSGVEVKPEIKNSLITIRIDKLHDHELIVLE
ncbi:alpha-amylase family protein [Neobacillus sp. NRS-1170]|uniref:alpha-amylase family protein n=1 Tax=Neobacillus sp. NRS-1170 TaxID=3233898 RepID=UPI003D27A210